MNLEKPLSWVIDVKTDMIFNLIKENYSIVIPIEKKKQFTIF